uniref:deoxynucleotidyltransferase terminal-interacting protein 2 n=1 Tax=Doryrhamphus excisus TaxID=161450 RepID=UPI0025AE79F0|nr:deoxynucleotidyltransferase terminal-interacting protein 2 [Doryrhamphus excisus]
MVATRRGVRVSSPTKTNVEQPSEDKATPSTGRRTRSAAPQVDNPTVSQLQESDVWTSTLKRCTRASRLHSPEQPCTPVGSIHESDVSDLESCCSDVNVGPVRRSSRRRPPSKVNQEDDISEAESCSSLVLKNVRSTRKMAVDKKLASSSSAVSDDEAPTRSRRVHHTKESKSDAESCSSAVSPTRTRRSTRKKLIPDPELEDETKDSMVDLVPESYQRVTRSQRKSVVTRRSAKRPQEDSEFSDAESSTSSVFEDSRSEVRRSTRKRNPPRPIPMNLDEVSVGSPTLRRTTRRTTTAPEKSCDSESFDSGPDYSVSTWDKTRSSRSKTVESDSDVTEGGGTPCSSRSGSGSSRRRAPVSMMKELVVVLENTVEELMDNSVLESTVVAEDADGTLLEEDATKAAQMEDIAPEDEEEKKAPPRNSKEDSGTEAAVASTGKHGELSVEDQDEDASPVEVETEETEKKLQRASDDKADQQGEPSAEEPAEEPKEGDASVEVMDETEASSTQPRSNDVEEEIMSTQTKTPHDVSGERLGDMEDTATSEAPPKHEKASLKTFSLMVSSDDDDDDDDDEEEEEDYISEEEENGGERPSISKKPKDTMESVEGLFMVDTRTGEDVYEDYTLERLTKEELVGGKHDDDEEEEFVDEEGSDDNGEADLSLTSENHWLKNMSSSIDPGIDMKQLGGLYITLDGGKSKPGPGAAKRPKKKNNSQDELMKKSVMGPDFEKKDSVPPYRESKQVLKKKHRVEREKSTGDSWFNMKAPELTKELQGDLQLLKMRGSLDPKRFYKKNDRDGFPKYFQVGTVVDNPVDFYHSRVPKKQRKRTMVEELLADAEFRHQNKKRYHDIVAEKAAQAAGKHRKFKKNRFHKKSEKVRK